jgi:hypothetical protein
MLTLFEFTYFAVYLTLITAWIVMIQMVNPGRQIREALQVQYTDEKFVENFQEEEPESEAEEEKAPFNPEEEPYKMTENPMFSHQESLEAKED